MHEYIGKICPYCKSEFVADDDIVVCSACDMPHHKDCWIENQGCTTFGCTGSIKSVDGTANSVTSQEITFEDTPVVTQPAATVYCSQCGTPTDASFSFCSKCGASLNTNVASNSASAYVNVNYGSNAQPVYSNQQYFNQGAAQNYSNYQQSYGAQNQYTQQPTFDNDTRQLIETKTDYYLENFRELKQQNKMNSWNWAAFCFAPYWFIYRKMYIHGGVVLAIAFLLSFVPALSIVILGGYVALGVFANYLYMIETEKKALHAKTLMEPLKTQYMTQNGGTNMNAAIIALVCHVILTAIISAF